MPSATARRACSTKGGHSEPSSFGRWAASWDWITLGGYENRALGGKCAGALLTAPLLRRCSYIRARFPGTGGHTRQRARRSTGADPAKLQETSSRGYRYWFGVVHKRDIHARPRQMRGISAGGRGGRPKPAREVKPRSNVAIYRVLVLSMRVKRTTLRS